MARKKIEPITSLGNENKLTVQKSLPLFSLWRSKMTLAEFKILDTYLSRIDSHKPEKRVVIFAKGELESLLGVKRIRTEELNERLKHLMGNVVSIDDGSFKKGFHYVTLFEEAVAEQDDNELWEVRLECTRKAMKYFFNIENLGYLRYKLRCITSISSRYTYIMFVYLESNRYRKSWDVSLDELKQILNCESENSYQQFKVFNDRILKLVQKELHEKTECKYTYEPIKKGRKVAAIRFTVETLSDKLQEVEDPNQMTLEQWGNVVSFHEELWHEPLEDFGFSKEQLEELRSVLVCVPVADMPKPDGVPDSEDFRQYHYMQIKTQEIKRRSPAHPFEYLLKVLKTDAGIS